MDFDGRVYDKKFVGLRFIQLRHDLSQLFRYNNSGPLYPPSAPLEPAWPYPPRENHFPPADVSSTKVLHAASSRR